MIIRLLSVVFTLSCSFRLLLALYAGLIVMFSFANLADNTGFGAVSLKAAKSTVQGFIFFNSYF